MSKIIMALLFGLMLTPDKGQAAVAASAAAKQNIANYPDWLTAAAGTFKAQPLCAACAVPKGNEAFLTELSANIKEAASGGDYFSLIGGAIELNAQKKAAAGESAVSHRRSER